MTIPPESIGVGQCYLTEDGKVRRVLRIMPDGRVHYEPRAAHVLSKSNNKTGMQDRRSFAAMAQRPVPCDWTPETDE